MNALLHTLETQPLNCSTQTLYTLAPPNRPSLAHEVVKAIGRTTKRSLKTLIVWTLQVCRYGARKWNEGTDLNNRMTTELDRNYKRNFYYIRSIM